MDYQDEKLWEMIALFAVICIGFLGMVMLFIYHILALKVEEKKVEARKHNLEVKVDTADITKLFRE